MKKRNGLRGFFLVLLLVLTFGLTVYAENDRKVVDMADILLSSEEEELQEKLERIAQTYQVDVVVASTDSCGSQSPQDYTDDFYEQMDYGYGDQYDGIILMVCMDERKFHLATQGKAIRIFTDYGLERIDELITPYLSDGEYSRAFSYFCVLAEQFIEEYEHTGEAFDVNNRFQEKLDFGTWLLISCGIGLLTALIVLIILLRQLKSVAPKHRAHEYVRNGSFRVTRQRDIFLYRTIHKRRIEKSSGKGGGGSRTHRTSGGRRAGGRTGSF